MHSQAGPGTHWRSPGGKLENNAFSSRTWDPLEKSRGQIGEQCILKQDLGPIGEVPGANWRTMHSQAGPGTHWRSPGGNLENNAFSSRTWDPLEKSRGQLGEQCILKQDLGPIGEV